MFINGVPRGAPAMPKEVAEAGLEIVAELLPGAMAREQAERDRIRAEQDRRRAEQERDHVATCRHHARAVAEAHARRQAARDDLAAAIAAGPVGQLLEADATLRTRVEGFRGAAAKPPAPVGGPWRRRYDRSTGAGRPPPARCPPAAESQVEHAWLVDTLLALPVLLEGVRQLHVQVARLEARG